MDDEAMKILSNRTFTTLWAESVSLITNKEATMSNDKRKSNSVFVMTLALVAGVCSTVACKKSTALSGGNRGETQTVPSPKPSKGGVGGQSTSGFQTPSGRSVATFAGPFHVGDGTLGKETSSYFQEEIRGSKNCFQGMGVDLSNRASPALAFDFDIKGSPLSLEVVVGKSCGASHYFYTAKLLLRQGTLTLEDLGRLAHKRGSEEVSRTNLSVSSRELAKEFSAGTYTLVITADDVATSLTEYLGAYHDMALSEVSVTITSGSGEISAGAVRSIAK